MSLFSSSKLQASASWYFLSLCSPCQRHRRVQAVLSLCSARQRYRRVQAGTFSVFVLVVRTTGQCKLVLSLSLFCSSKAHAHASRWYFLRLCSPRQNHLPVQVGTVSVFVLLFVKTSGPCKLVLSLSLFCSSSKPQASASW